MKVRKRHSDRAGYSSSSSMTALFASCLAASAIPLAASQQIPFYQKPWAAIFPVLPPGTAKQAEPVLEATHDFTLRHIFHHGTYQDPDLHRRMDIHQNPESWMSKSQDQALISRPDHFTVKSRPTEIQRLSDRAPVAIESHLRTARLTGQPAVLEASAWTLDTVPGPNVSDRATVITLARMAANAYVDEPGEGEWEDVGGGYNRSAGFGWEEDGLRGYVFADKDNSTVVMGLKGTSPAVFDGSETTTNDKVNDNLFFSCCCGQGGQYLWKRVCECQSSTYTCNQTCLVKELKAENRYYRASIELYTNVTKLYPNSEIWLTGHSLGGSVSALLGLTFGVPVTTFEAPGDDLPAKRLGLPSPPDSDPHRPHVRAQSGANHFGHTADPIFMGSCNGATATCTFGGYALESQCHTGNVCIYDTVADRGWRVGVGNHKIHVVIDSVLEQYDSVPKCEPDRECIDCFNWKYFEDNGTSMTTSSSSSTTTKTRTATCETPGWWGCLDKTTATTTTSTSTSTSTTSRTTTTCETPGWFGCNDPTTSSTVSKATPSPSLTSVTITSHRPQPSDSSSSCRTPGWFGHCNDVTSTSQSKKHTATRSQSSSHECQTPGRLWGCRDHSTVESFETPSITSAAFFIPSTSSAQAWATTGDEL